ncbi:Uncharacterized protein C2orf78-like [Cricetulus griseus]|uniref:Uncharacterized protein C2orf78-like n=1 Tax=Cricetulus griseus TaxID=10029 RepID=G3IHG1_CRIGR|nr:Uncharacterized protein C2orf78-like [Cricetulus griseus]
MKFPSHHFPTVLFLPTDNFQSAPFYGTECALRPSVPVLRNSTPSAGSVCNFSRVSTPAVSSAWLLPSDPSTCCQQLMDSDSLYQRAGTTMLTTLTDQSQISTSALSYPDALPWDLTGSTDRREAAFRDFTVTIIDQNTTLSSLSMTAQCDNILDPNALVPFYPTLSASLIQGTPPQVSNQGDSLAPSYQEGNQVYYYDHNSLGPVMAGELLQCLQAYGSVSYPGSQASTLQPEMVMVLKEIQPTNVQTSFSTSAIYYPRSAETMTDTSLQVVDMQTSLGLIPSGQTLCLLQSSDLCNACTQDAQIKTPPVDGDRSLTAPIHSPSEFLALPPAPALEQTENNNLDEMTANLSTSLDSYEGTTENQDSSLFPLVHPNVQQALHYTDAERIWQKPASDNATLGSSSLDQKELGSMQSVMGSGIDFADMTTMVADIHLPQVFNSLSDVDQFQDTTATQSKDVRSDQTQESPSIISVPSDQVRKGNQNASELLDGAPQVKNQCQDVVEGEGAEGSARASEGAIDNMAKHLDGTAQKSAHSRPRISRAQGQDKNKRTRENKTKKKGELKPSCPRVKAEEKPTIPKTKRTRNPPELSQDSFKKPRTHLGMHMLESVQVFHPLGKKSEKKMGISSSRALLNLSSNKDPRTGPATTSLLDVSCDGRGPAKTPGNAQRPESSAQKECPTLSQYELPPPGKVKLVPLPFPALDKPQARPLSRKLLSLASRKPTAAYAVRPHSHSAQSTTLKPSQPAPASISVTASDKTAVPTTTYATRPNTTNPIQSCTRAQSFVSRPAPYRASSHTSLQRELVSAARNKVPSPPKPQTQYLLQDFSRQPIPWRKVDIPGPTISQPITAEQRPEREAMKRRAQQDRENAAKYTSLGKLQLFLQREKDMEISRYYGYAM